MERVDLHAHTSASDGSLSPAELVRRAAGLGLAALAITDHDSLQGLPAGLAAGRALGLEVIAGVELSTRREGLGSLHLIGLWVATDEPGLLDLLAGQRASRAERNTRVLARLSALGMPLDPNAVARHAGGEIIGRPHLALAMVDAGHVASVGEAFSRWLARGRPAYVERARPTPEEAIACLHGAWGLAVLAHPGVAWAGGREEHLAELGRLADAGLDALEARHPDVAPDWGERLAAEAGRLGLGLSGGSDFHGAAKPSIELGEPPVPAAWLAGLKARWVARFPDRPPPW